MSKKPKVNVLPIEQGATPDPQNANKHTAVKKFLQVEVVALEESATVDLLNTNKHTQRGRGNAENSLRRRGINRPIAAAGKGVKVPVISAGNQTFEIAAEIGIKEAVIVHTRGDQMIINVRDDIAPNSAEFHALSIEDNATAEFNPDIDLIASLAAGDSAILSALKNEDKMFGGMLENMGVREETIDAEPQIDRAEELQEKWKVQRGDLYQIGIHRLLCGDSTKREDVERVMDGEKADMTVTSPPYFNMREYSFFETYGDYLAFVRLVINEIKNIANDSSFALLWNVPTDIPNERDMHSDTSIIAREIGYRFKGDICWIKSGSSSSSMRSNHIITNSHYYPLLKHEPILIFILGKYPAFDKSDTEYVNNILGDVWEIQQVMGSEQKKTGHNAPFPLELANRCVLSFSKKRAIVYEPFGGSGTVMMVCENVKRINRTIEVSEKYCAVILERMSTAFPELEIKKL